MAQKLWHSNICLDLTVENVTEDYSIPAPSARQFTARKNLNINGGRV